MTGIEPAVLGVYKDRPALEQALVQLKQEGFSPSEISVLVPPHADDAPSSIQGTKIGAGTGAILGGVLGWLIGAGLLTIPGVGALIIAGPIGTSIAGTAVGGGVGGIVGSFAGLGLTNDAARNYESRLKRGEPILSVQCEDPNRSKLAAEIFKRTGAEDIFSQEFNAFSAKSSTHE